MANEILKGLIDIRESREVVLKKIFEFVQSFQHSQYRLFPQQNLSNLIQTRTGTSSDINLLLCLLLNEGGIPAKPVLTSTKFNGKLSQQFPILNQFNHLMVALLEKDSLLSFVDAVSPSTNYRLIPATHINYWGFMLDGKIAVG